MDEIVWEEPPETRRGHPGPTVWQRRLAPVVERPGEWAWIVDTPPNMARGFARTMKAGRIMTPDGTLPQEWEAVCRTVDGKPRLYVRYLPKPKAVEEAS